LGEGFGGVRLVVGLVYCGRCVGSDAGRMRCDGLVDRFAEVVEHVPAVRDLHCVRCAGAGAVGVGTGPVPADHLHAWVGAKPGGQRFAVAAREDIDRPVGGRSSRIVAVDVSG
jgi:hypothetical protein